MRVFPHKLDNRVVSSVKKLSLEKPESVQSIKKVNNTYVYSSMNVGIVSKGKGGMCIRKVDISHDKDVMEIETEIGDFTLDKSTVNVTEPLMYLPNDLIYVDDLLEVFKISDTSLTLNCVFRDKSLHDLYFECETEKPLESIVEDLYGIYGFLGLYHI